MAHRIRITTIAPHSQTLEGTLFTACPLLNVVALNTTPDLPSPQPADYHVIPVSKIQSVQVLSVAEGNAGGLETALPPIAKVDVRRLREREESRVRKAQEEERKRGKGVTREGQAVYDALDRMYVPHPYHPVPIYISSAVHCSWCLAEG